MKKREPKPRKRKSVGLALGGGGARGLAHIGVIRVLRQAGIDIDYIAGTSMGSLVGGFYAATQDIDLLEKLFSNITEKDMVPIRKMLHVHSKLESPFKDTKPVVEILKSHIKGFSIEKCKIPFAAIATDAKSGDMVVLKKGPLVEAIQASSALPLVFAPVTVNGRLLSDGGMVDPVPADVVRDMGAEYVIAVDVSSRWPDISEETVSIHGIKSIIADALPALEYQLVRRIITKADIALRPPVMQYHWFDFPEAKDIIKQGAEEIALHLKEICRSTGYPEPKKTPVQKFVDFLFDDTL